MPTNQQLQPIRTSRIRFRAINPKSGRRSERLVDFDPNLPKKRWCTFIDVEIKSLTINGSKLQSFGMLDLDPKSSCIPPVNMILPNSVFGLRYRTEVRLKRRLRREAEIEVHRGTFYPMAPLSCFQKCSRQDFELFSKTQSSTL